MNAPPLSVSILSAMVAAVATTVVFDGPLAQFAPAPQVAASSAIPATTTVVNRERKGDRLDVKRAAGGKNTTIVLKNTNAPDRNIRDANDTPVRGLRRQIDDGKPAPAPLQHCEALASPVSDPVLGKVMGRCFV